jgi:hypothetical protein
MRIRDLFCSKSLKTATRRLANRGTSTKASARKLPPIGEEIARIRDAPPQNHRRVSSALCQD